METETKETHPRRDSYRELMSLPAWHLYGRDDNGNLVSIAKTHAATAQQAWGIFKRYGYGVENGVVIFR